MKTAIKLVSVILLLAATAATLKLYLVVAEKGHDNWLPAYLMSFLQQSHPSYSEDKIEHIMVVIADHHEQPRGEAAAAATREWLAKYKQTIAGLEDDYGNPVRYSWFYPYDHKNDDSLLLLNQAVHEGLGEIEFHWHHVHENSAAFERDLAAAVKWFTSYGAFVSEAGGQPRFAFIHGNWSLDNSRGADYCGVNNEIDLLSRYGGYMDMTFFCCSEAQPAMPASIYYVKDNPELPKSYNKGRPAAKGKSSDDFMLVTGPLAINTKTRHFEVGQLEAWWGSDWASRIPLWVSNAPFVEGRPDWRILKLYTHGVQSKKLILSENFHRLFVELKQYTASHNIKLHFVTAREAYNIIKAAEMDKKDDPEHFKSFLIPAPLNSRQLIDSKI